MTAPRDAKEAIERAALRLFVEQGISETSIRDIAREAGVSLGAMYNHYVGKEELAWTLFSQNVYKIGTELRQLAQEHKTLEGKLRAMIGHVFAQFDADWTGVSFVFFARHQYLRRITRQRNNPHVIFRSVIADASVRGEIPRQDLDMATSLVVGAILQVIDTAIFWRDRVDRPLRGSTEQVTAACLRIVRQ